MNHHKSQYLIECYIIFRILWRFLFFGAVTAVVTLALYLLWRSIKPDLVVKIETENEDSIVFPALTICSMNQHRSDTQKIFSTSYFTQRITLF